MPRSITVLPLFAALALCACDSATKTGTGSSGTDRVLGADKEPGNWLAHGRTYGEQRYSPLAKISAATVPRLALAWSYELKSNRGAEATPIVIDGTMYVTSAWSIVSALDAKTGAERWVYDPKVNRSFGAKACCDVVNRGVAVSNGKVYVGTIDGRLVALDAKTGAVLWDKVTVDQTQDYTITGAPRVAKELVFIGNGGAEYGVRGYVSAYDANDGKMVWRFYTVPGDPSRGPDHAASDSVMAKAAATWTGSWWTLGGGGTVWDAIVYDPEFDQLIIGVGNGSPWNRQVRSPRGGDNLFLSSIVALDAKTGAYKWHYQTTPGESWDYTATQPIMLADLDIGGQLRKVAMQAPKNGFFYVLDRANGKLISADAFLPMFTTANTPKGAPLSWASAVDSVTGRPVENPEARYVGATALIRPSPFGAHSWHPMSYSPQTGLVYLPAQDIALDFTSDAGFVSRPGLWNNAVTNGPFPDDPKIREIIKNSSKGFLIAWDPVKRKAAWTFAHRGPWPGGTLATAGGLVFQGTVDGHFLALDAATGKQLWDYDNQAATMSVPDTFEVDGEQYVTVLGGYGSAFFTIAGVLAPKEGISMPGRVSTFKLDGTAPRPQITFTQLPTPKPPVMHASPQDVGAGAVTYQRYCMRCHGFAAVGGGVLPDLRRSPVLQSADLWKDLVIGGGRVAAGMPSFAQHVTPTAAEQVRAYVAQQLAMLYAAKGASKP